MAKAAAVRNVALARLAPAPGLRRRSPSRTALWAVDPGAGLKHPSLKHRGRPVALSLQARAQELRSRSRSVMRLAKMSRNAGPDIAGFW
jgi:hypothetical protein